MGKPSPSIGYYADVVYKLQLALLDGIADERKLLLSGSLLSRSDYEDVVTERTIANFCGYPLCDNPLPSDLPKKGRYRISLREHKVYDLKETFLYCSSGCLIKSRAFAETLNAERCTDLDDDRISRILNAFNESGGFETVEKEDGLGLRELKILEKLDLNEKGKVPPGEFFGPSDAIEGYVPQKDWNRSSKSSPLKKAGEVSKAGIIIIPHDHNINEVNLQKVTEKILPTHDQSAPLKISSLSSDIFDPDNSWYDLPPEGFSLTLSSFATMWMALFGWITASSLVYIYGREESAMDDFFFVNGKEYPRKIVIGDGLSSEIKQTLAGCLSRALPSLVASLRVATLISTLEQAMGRLLDTMSFFDPVPSFRMKQWHVIVLLFLDALSVHRVPSVEPCMASRTMLAHKVLDAAQVSIEEYDAMKDHILPLGRDLGFSAQNGG